MKLQSLRRLTALYVIKLGAVLGYDEAFINASLHTNVSIVLEMFNLSALETFVHNFTIDRRLHKTSFMQ